MQMKLAVVGSRSINNRGRVYKCLDDCLDKANEIGKELVLVSGGARGIDTMAMDFAKDRGLTIIIVYPDWDKHGRSAGFKRNHVIWEIADCGIAFWDGVSKGTEHSFDLAKQQDKQIAIINVNELPW